MTGFTLRVTGYVILIAGVIELVVLSIDVWGWQRVVLEGGLMEWFQASAVFAAAGMATVLAWRARDARGLYSLIAAGLWMILFREFDNSVAYRMVPWWVKRPIPPLVFAVIVALDRRRIVAAAREQLRHPETLLLVLGAGVLAWAELLGQPRVWKVLCPPDYGPCRSMAEESLELAGHLLLAFGLAETYVRLVRGARA